MKYRLRPVEGGMHRCPRIEEGSVPREGLSGAPFYRGDDGMQVGGVGELVGGGGDFGLGLVALAEGEALRFLDGDGGRR